ncbi:hypothetical protein AB7C87_09210 [Natrarchaeobius sp. A-rgal3]|uniref:DUF7351 domain-containing protein n=1 Tax=Natrarchaeobius versutus TaxID=1679078 RepID=UPI003510175B
MSPNEDGTGLSPIEAFSIVGNDIRAEILLALVERGSNTATFSELRNAVDVTDSGQFNYHLERLVDHFVERTEEGYGLTEAGRRISYALLSGTYTERPQIETTNVPGTCYACGSDALCGRYDETLEIECDDCGERILAVPFPPAAAANRSPVEVFRAFDRWSDRQAALVTDRICPECAGKLSATVTADVPPSLGFDRVPRFECSICTYTTCVTFGTVALHADDVRPVVHRCGWERDDVYWSVDHRVTDEHTSVASEEPLRVRETFDLPGGTVVVTFDERVEIVDVDTNPAN